MKKLFDQIHKEDESRAEQGRENKLHSFSNEIESESPTYAININRKFNGDFSDYNAQKLLESEEPNSNNESNAPLDSMPSFDEIVPQNSIDISFIEHQRMDTINESE